MSKINVVIDCDPGIDDALALMTALLSEEMNVLGISICGGNHTVDKGYINAKRILHLLGKDVEVVKGYASPLDRPLQIADDTHGADGFGEYGPAFDEAYHFTMPAEPQRGLIDFYRDVFIRYDDVVLIAIGPLTNIRGLLMEIPEHFLKVKRLVSMGGNYKSHGNTSPLAEFNYWVDPEAASFVFRNAPVPVEMVGLDVTREVVLEDMRMKKLQESNPTMGAFIKELTKFYYAFHRKYEDLDGCVINDPLAVAHVLDDGLLEGFEAYTDVAAEGIARGVSVVDDHDFWHQPANAKVFTKVDVEGFFHLFNGILRSAHEIY